MEGERDTVSSDTFVEAYQMLIIHRILLMWQTSIHRLTIEVCNALQESPNLTVRGDKLRHSCPRL